MLRGPRSHHAPCRGARTRPYAGPAVHAAQPEHLSLSAVRPPGTEAGTPPRWRAAEEGAGMSSPARSGVSPTTPPSCSHGCGHHPSRPRAVPAHQGRGARPPPASPLNADRPRRAAEPGPRPADSPRQLPRPAGVAGRTDAADGGHRTRAQEGGRGRGRRHTPHLRHQLEPVELDRRIDGSSPRRRARTSAWRRRPRLRGDGAARDSAQGHRDRRHHTRLPSAGRSEELLV